jgi:hypothetical protein
MLLPIHHHAFYIRFSAAFCVRRITHFRQQRFLPSSFVTKLFTTSTKLRNQTSSVKERKRKKQETYLFFLVLYTKLEAFLF